MKKFVTNSTVLLAVMGFGFYIGSHSSVVEQHAENSLASNQSVIKKTETSAASVSDNVVDGGDNVSVTLQQAGSITTPVKHEGEPAGDDQQPVPHETLAEKTLALDTDNPMTNTMDNQGHYQNLLSEHTMGNAPATIGDAPLDNTYFNPAELDLGDPAVHGDEDPSINAARIELAETLRSSGLSEADIRANVLSVFPTPVTMYELNKKQRRAALNVSPEKVESQLRNELRSQGLAEADINFLIDGLIGKESRDFN